MSDPTGQPNLFKLQIRQAQGRFHNLHNNMLAVLEEQAREIRALREQILRETSALDIHRRRIERWGLEVTKYGGQLQEALDLAAPHPAMCLAKCRRILESLLHHVFERHQKEGGTRPLKKLIEDLARDNHIPRKIRALCEVVRELGNAGVHAIRDKEIITHRDSEIALHALILIVEWFARSNSKEHTSPPPHPPTAIPVRLESSTPHDGEPKRTGVFNYVYPNPEFENSQDSGEYGPPPNPSGFNPPPPTLE